MEPGCATAAAPRRVQKKAGGRAPFSDVTHLYTGGAGKLGRLLTTSGLGLEQLQLGEGTAAPCRTATGKASGALRKVR